MKKKVFVYAFCFASVMSACTNPTIAVEPDIKRFHKEHPDHIQTFKATHRSIRYAWSGDAKKRPLIFVHGSPGSWDGWANFLMNTELQKNFQIIAVDRPGYGGSGHDKAEESLVKQSDDIMEVLKINKSDLPAILIGHSYGGPVIARAAMDHADQIAALIFVAASVDPSLEETKWYQYPAGWWPIRYLIPNALRVCNEEILALKSELKEMMPLWPKIRAKVVVIQGLDDSLVPPANADFLESHINKSHLIEVNRVKGLNHFVPWNRPELILTAIQEAVRNTP